MKATLEFNLPEERGEHIRAVHAGAAWLALSDIDRQIRNAMKYGLQNGVTHEDLLKDIRREIGEAILLLGDE